MSESVPAGARLKAEREKKGWSAQKMGNEMHLDAWVIEALEAGDYARIGPRVYAKGHLKKYAALMGLPVDELLHGFDEPSVQPNLSLGAPRLPDGQSKALVSSAQMLTGALAVAMIAALAWWHPWQPRGVAAHAPPDSSGSGAGQADIALPSRSPSGEPASPEPRALAAVAHGASEPAAAALAALPPAVAAGPGSTLDGTPQPGAGRARLRLSFTSDSWVDVRDALGNKAFVGNGSANTVKTISGLAPMRVYLRSGSGVQLEINGRVVAIGPQFFAGDVAHFEAGADGVIRRDAHRDAPRADQSSRPPG
jgi:cytoskeleton protein RodZ